MSPKTIFQKPRSLTQHFEAPEDFTGLFGWVCGYSADVTFMNEALARFTGQSEGQRAHKPPKKSGLATPPSARPLRAMRSSVPPHWPRAHAVGAVARIAP